MSFVGESAPRQREGRGRWPKARSRRVPMTRDKAAMLRLLHAEGALALDLAAVFGCSRATVDNIVAGRSWNDRPCSGCWRLLEPGDYQRGRCQECQAQT